MAKRIARQLDQLAERHMHATDTHTHTYTHTHIHTCFDLPGEWNNGNHIGGPGSTGAGVSSSAAAAPRHVPPPIETAQSLQDPVSSDAILPEASERLSGSTIEDFEEGSALALGTTEMMSSPTMGSIAKRRSLRAQAAPAEE